MKEIVTAKLFKNGNSQAVRLPKEFRFEGDEVLIHREGKRVIIEGIKKKKKSKWDDFFADNTVVPDNFLIDRGDEPPQERELF